MFVVTLIVIFIVTVTVIIVESIVTVMFYLDDFIMHDVFIKVS